MSHVVTIQTKVHDPATVAAACRRLGLPEPVPGTVRLNGGEATGRTMVRLRLDPRFLWLLART
jgi:hypothetical protein